MNPDRLTAEIAKRHGVLLDRDDPVLLIHTMLELQALDSQAREQRLAEREERLATRDEQTAAALRQVLKDAETQASGRLALAAAADLPGMLGRMIAQRDKWQAMIVAGVVMIATLTLGFGSYWLGYSRGYDRGTEQIVRVQSDIARDLDGMSGTTASDWVALMRWNANSLARSRSNCWQSSTGRTACFFALWTQPPTPPQTPSARQGG